MSKTVIGLGVNLIQIEMIKVGHSIQLELSNINGDPVLTREQRERVFFLMGKLEGLQEINEFIRRDGKSKKEE